MTQSVRSKVQNSFHFFNVHYLATVDGYSQCTTGTNVTAVDQVGYTPQNSRHTVGSNQQITLACPTCATLQARSTYRRSVRMGSIEPRVGSPLISIPTTSGPIPSLSLEAALNSLSPHLDHCHPSEAGERRNTTTLNALASSIVLAASALQQCISNIPKQFGLNKVKHSAQHRTRVHTQVAAWARPMLAAYAHEKAQQGRCHTHNVTRSQTYMVLVLLMLRSTRTTGQLGTSCAAAAIASRTAAQYGKQSGTLSSPNVSAKSAK